MNTDNTGYSPKYIRFVMHPLHAEEYREAYLAPDHRAARNVLERLSREFHTLPKGHICTCECPYEKPGWPPCLGCRPIRAARVNDVTVEIGRGSPVEAPMPMVLLLDLERAISVLGASTSPYEVSRWLSGQEDAA